MVTQANSINEAGASGLVNFNGTATFGTTACTQYNVLTGASANTVNNVTPSATSGVPLISQGSSSQPAFGTATVPGGGTGAVTLTGVLTGNGTSAITASAVTQYDVLVGGASNAVSSVGPGSAGQVLQSGGAAANPAYSTATYPATATGTGTILRADGTNWTATTSTYPNTNAVSTLLYASSANVMGALTTGNNGVLITSASGVPSWLADGTTGQVLMATTGSPPTWAANSGIGNLVLIQSQTASNSASLTYTTGITSTYNNYMLVCSNVFPVTNNAYLWVQVSTNGGSSYLATGYLSGAYVSIYNASSFGNTNTTSAFQVGYTLSNSANGDTYASVLNLQDFTIATAGSCPKITGLATGCSGSSTSPYIGFTTGSNTTAAGSAVNAIKILMSTGNISTGTFTLFGILE